MLYQYNFSSLKCCVCVNLKLIIIRCLTIFMRNIIGMKMCIFPYKVHISSKFWKYSRCNTPYWCYYKVYYPTLLNQAQFLMRFENYSRQLLTHFFGTNRTYVNIQNEYKYVEFSISIWMSTRLCPRPESTGSTGSGLTVGSRVSPIFVLVFGVS